MKKYLITSPDFYTDDVDIFKQKFEESIKKYKPDFALLRDKTTSHYEDLAKVFVTLCSFYGIKSFLHRDINLAKQLNADGVHLTSTQFEEIQKSEQLELIISTHTIDEVLYAQNSGVDYVTYSPIFDTPNKGKPKGIKNLKEILDKSTIKVFALGGIVSGEHIKMLEGTEVYGFASIRYFTKSF